jgi:hypothetical protein
MGAAMYGTFVQTITCRTVEYESRKVDGFYNMMVEVAVRPAHLVVHQLHAHD